MTKEEVNNQSWGLQISAEKATPEGKGGGCKVNPYRSSTLQSTNYNKDMETEESSYQEVSSLPQLQLSADVAEACVADRDRVWNRSPWTINGAHLALKAWRPEMLIRDFDFSHSTFWIQIRGLPLQYMSKENGLKIGGLFKEVLKCHLKQKCKAKVNTSAKTEGDEHGAWLRAESGSFTVREEEDNLPSETASQEQPVDLDNTLVMTTGGGKVQAGLHRQ
ncbi:hypothetical protein FEM48_Zijuj04G0037200 [Ziziphus jujuba var. spinosa]|uniref:DUF4283 domain-containing protein n=1 Tax=Ziziphus jujuba var. spinosa TaxID=714518 RepID=A0A978VHL8_ZIZJJ|nr:hypothetical protein FEM48_Zijuj04G0037200 [Ziziphus jujuba var. spinosa]